MRFAGATRRLVLVAVVVAVAGAGVAGLVALTSGSDDSTAGAPPPLLATPDQRAPAPFVLPAPALPLPPLPLPPLPPIPLPLVPRPPAPAVPRPAPAGPPCVVPAGVRQRDVDPTDPPDYSWPRARGQKVVVSFATGGLPRRYANAVVAGARLWSRSTCVQVLAVPRCPPRGHCSTVATRRSGGGDAVDGNSESTSQNDVRIGNAITLYTSLLDSSTDNGALGTVVHEMGHALGLRHRNDPRSIMAATTAEDTDPRPDAIDFGNLAVLYGERVAR